MREGKLNFELGSSVRSSQPISHKPRLLMCYISDLAHHHPLVHAFLLLGLPLPAHLRAPFEG